MRKLDKKEISLVLEPSGLQTDRSYTLPGNTSRRDGHFDFDHVNYHTSRTNESGTRDTKRIKQVYDKQPRQDQNQIERVNLYSSLEKCRPEYTRRGESKNGISTDRLSTDSGNQTGRMSPSRSKDRKHRNKNVLTNITNFNDSLDKDPTNTSQSYYYNDNYKSLGATFSPRFYTAQTEISIRDGPSPTEKGRVSKVVGQQEENPISSRKTKSIAEIHLDGQKSQKIRIDMAHHHHTTSAFQSMQSVDLSRAGKHEKDTMKSYGDVSQSILMDYEREKKSNEKKIETLKVAYNEIKRNYEKEKQHDHKKFNALLAEKEYLINSLIEEKERYDERISELERINNNCNKEIQALRQREKQRAAQFEDLKRENVGLRQGRGNSDADILLQRIDQIEAQQYREKMQVQNSSADITIKELEHKVSLLLLDNEKLRSQIETSKRSETSRGFDSGRSYIPDVTTKSLSTNVMHKKFVSLNTNEIRSMDIKKDNDHETGNIPINDEEHPNFKELVEYKRNTCKFLEKLSELVIQLSPPKQFNEPPSLKDIWKWLQTLLTGYKNLKQSYKELDEALHSLGEFLEVEKKDINSAVKNLVLHNTKLSQLVEKARSLLDQTQAQELEAYEDIMEGQYSGAQQEN